MANKGDVLHHKQCEGVKKNIHLKNIVCGLVIKGILMDNEPRTLFCQVYGRDW